MLTVKARLAEDGVRYRLVKRASLLGFLVELLSGSGNGGDGIPVAAARASVSWSRETFREEFGTDLPAAWDTVMAWCDGFMAAGRIEVFGTGSQAKRPGWPRRIVEANRSLRATVSNRVVWLPSAAPPIATKRPGCRSVVYGESSNGLIVWKS